MPVKPQASAPSGVVFVDADNTLWDTDGVFAKAQLELLKTIETVTGAKAPGTDRLAWVRQLDQGIAAGHHQGLRYPVRLLSNAINRALRGLSVDNAIKASLRGEVAEGLVSVQLDRAEQAYFSDLKEFPPLLDGVRQGLERFHQLNLMVVVLTEGSRSRIDRTVEDHALGKLIERVIEAPKLPSLFRRVLRLTHHPEISFMIGDQLKSDIRPASEAGITTIYIPGRFKPEWEILDRTTKPNFTFRSFGEAVQIIESQVAMNV